MSKLYLCGPMSGIPHFNFPAFDEAAKNLREQGWNIVSPAELDSAKSRDMALKSKDGDISSSQETWGDYLSRDVKIIADEVVGLVFLPGWWKSRGARLEAFTALLAYKNHYYEYKDGTLYPMNKTLVREILKENMPG